MRLLRLFRLGALAIALAVGSEALAQVPAGWFAAGTRPADYEFGVDAQASARSRDRFLTGQQESYTGRNLQLAERSAFIRGKPQATTAGFATLMQSISAETWRGKRVRLTAKVRTRGAQRAQMWMRVDGQSRQVLAFDSMSNRPITGSRPWRSYAIVLDVPRTATTISYGFMLSGRGTVWADDFRVQRVDGDVPVTAPPRLPSAPRNPGFER